jgi:arylsulfatase A-like enzyme
MDSEMTRRGWLSATVGGAASAAGHAARDTPNVLVFFTDQQRWDTIGAYGGPMEITPNLDRFCGSGTRFERAFTVQPVCAPARSTVQTGQYPTTTGVISNGFAQLKPDAQTLGHYFSNAGYYTGYIGKWHLAGLREHPVPRERRGGYRDWWTASDVPEFTSMPYEGHLFDADNNKIPFSDKYRVDAFTDLAIQFLRQRSASKPFFLFVSYGEPHHQNQLNAFVAPKGYADRYRNNFYVPPDLLPYPGDWKSQLPEYYGIIARIDECFGRLMEELRRQNLDGNTVVAFSTDHGCHFRTRNSEYKRSCHDSSIRIPLVFRGPGFPNGRVAQELVSLADLAPTLLNAAGIPVPAHMQGRSLMPLANGDASGWTNEVLVLLREVELARVWRTEQWKYSVFDPEAPKDTPFSSRYVERQFYDLLSDPAEHVNLIGRRQFRPVADQLQTRLIERLQAIGQPAPTIVPARYYA